MNKLFYQEPADTADFEGWSTYEKNGFIGGAVYLLGQHRVKIATYKDYGIGFVLAPDFFWRPVVVYRPKNESTNEEKCAAVLERLVMLLDG